MSALKISVFYRYWAHNLFFFKDSHVCLHLAGNDFWLPLVTNIFWAPRFDAVFYSWDTGAKKRNHHTPTSNLGTSLRRFSVEVSNEYPLIIFCDHLRKMNKPDT